MEFNEVIANKIFTVLAEVLPADFGIVYDSYADKPIDFDIIKHKLNNVDSDISIHFGATKMAITSPNLGNVAIKVPFLGYYRHSTNYDDAESYEEAESLSFDSKYQFWKFDGGDGRYNNDYCITELQNYKEIKEYGFEEFVAETRLLGWIDNKCIIIQEYVVPEDIDSEQRSFSPNSYKSSEQLREEHDDITCMMSDDWIAALIEFYGENLCERFFDFCEDDGYYIVRDAHGMNYGYRKNGSPAFLDFSDYYE